MRHHILSLSAYLCCTFLLWPAHAVAAESSALPFKTESSDGPSLGALSVFVLIFTVLLMVWLKLLKRKQGGKSPTRWLHWLPARQDDSALIILASKRVTPRMSLHVVEWEGGKVLVSVADQRVVRLGEVKATTQAPQTEDASLFAS